MRTDALKLPSPADAREAKKALRHLATVDKQGPRRRRAGIRLRMDGDPAGPTVIVPRVAFEVLLEVLGQMANGNSVVIVPVHAQLTTQQAAELLNVSRPHLIALLEAGKIPFRLVGTHRRVRLDDLMKFKRKDDAARDEAASELTHQAEELGLGY